MTALDVLRFLLFFILNIHGLQGADVYGTEGGSVVFPCDISYNPAVSLFWQVQPENINVLIKNPGNGSILSLDHWKGRVDLVEGQNLRIQNVSRQDDSSAVGGDYRCAQMSTVGQESTLTVRYPPSRIAVTGHNSSTSLHPGDELQLSCNTDESNPAPTFTWYKNGLRISDSQTLNISPVKLENNGDIIICKVRVYDRNDPVFSWEDESEKIALVVTNHGNEPDSGTTSSGPGQAVVLGLSIGIPIALVLAIGIGITICLVRKSNCRPTPVPSGDPNSSEEGRASNGSIHMRTLPSENSNGVVPSDSHGGVTDTADATGELVVETSGPPAGPDYNAEPDAESRDSRESGHNGTSEHPISRPSSGVDGGLPFPVSESGGAPPSQPVSSNDTPTGMWLDIFDTVARNLTAKNRMPLARALGLSETEISNIEEDHQRDSKEKLHQVLVLWREKNPSASPDTLATALRSRSFNAVAKKVEDCWRRYGQR